MITLGTFFSHELILSQLSLIHIVLFGLVKKKRKKKPVWACKIILYAPIMYGPLVRKCDQETCTFCSCTHVHILYELIVLYPKYYHDHNRSSYIISNSRAPKHTHCSALFTYWCIQSIQLINPYLKTSIISLRNRTT